MKSRAQSEVIRISQNSNAMLDNAVSLKLQNYVTAHVSGSVAVMLFSPYHTKIKAQLWDSLLCET